MDSRVSERKRARRVDPTLPIGILTFLMTDIESSTRAMDSAPRSAKKALQLHDRIVVEHVERNHGQMVEAGREGDSILAVFRQATDALACAVDAQRALQRDDRLAGAQMAVRIAVHTGEAELREGHYVGASLYRCARMMAIAHGGQVLISRSTQEIVADDLPDGVILRDLGEHRLKDLSRAENIYQVVHADLRADFPPLKSLEASRTNLPEQLTSFIGRRAELSGVRRALKTARMVTLTGAGGIGKSRLALQVARDLVDRSPDGVWWVDLTPVGDADQVPSIVASALNLAGGVQPSERVISWLSKKEAVLVIDNCEHLVAACARFCEAVLTRCPHVSVLATSRVPLAVGGEARWPVSVMSSDDALSLFEQRGQLVEPGFKVSDKNRAEVSGICRRLDDLPLAIELAASRLGMMSEREISSQLADRFHLLSASHSSDPRHQTMTATIDWSYRLLNDAEATLLRRLSAFRGGFGFDAVVAVCSDEQVPDVLAALSGLVEKSMVVVERLEAEETRYRLLESQMVFAEDKLESSGEIDTIRARHFDFFDAAIKARTSGLAGPMSKVVMGAAEATWKWRELPNVWAAMRWARENRQDLGLDFAAHAGFIESMNTRDIRTWLVELLALSPAEGPARLTALSASSTLAYIQGDWKESARLAQVAADYVQPEPFRKWQEAKAMALNQLAGSLDAMGDYDGERAALEQAIGLARDTDNVRVKLALHHGLGTLALVEGKLEDADEHLMDALQLADPKGNMGMIGGLLESIANVKLAQGDVAGAESYWKRSLVILHELLRPYGQIGSIGGLARLATAKGEHARAMRIAAAHQRLCEEWSLSEHPWWQAQLDSAKTISRDKLGAKKADEAWQQGFAMDLDHAVAYALEESETPRAEAGPLSRREVDVTRLVAAGLTNKEVAAKLFLSERTVEGHVDRVKGKLGVRSRAEIGAWWSTHGLTLAEK